VTTTLLCWKPSHPALITTAADTRQVYPLVQRPTKSCQLAAQHTRTRHTHTLLSHSFVRVHASWPLLIRPKKSAMCTYPIKTLL
jgi:hypothetical protein